MGVLSDGTFACRNAPAFTFKHLGGAATRDGHNICGPFNNSGVGTGQRDGPPGAAA